MASHQVSDMNLTKLVINSYLAIGIEKISQNGCLQNTIIQLLEELFGLVKYK